MVNDPKTLKHMEPRENLIAGLEAARRSLTLSVATRRFGMFAAALALLFAIPLIQLGALAFKEDLYSHVFLMPFIAGYLIWLTRHQLPAVATPTPVGATVFAGLGLLLIIAFGVMAFSGSRLPRNDSLALTIGAFVCSLASAAFLNFGWNVIRVVALPSALFLFLIPFPTAVRHWLEVSLQHSSAEVSYWLLQLTQVPVLREGVVFHLPGITIQVAEECSGIRSSFVLFITGLIAGYMFLERPWNRLWFALITIPLGIVRNGFRVMTLSLLCVHIDPEMIHSPIHHRGGPIFFVLSLIPLFALLLFVRKREQARLKQAKSIPIDAPRP